ncbi:MAG: xanthine dehydrogenase family protein subunit M [Tistlia sp.]|uniref:xanthine dehydrogenase family protein subunit M n=1 Tax=Tistlia sp. TaxID=3057121 RepID=UPI0034A4B8A0
MKPAAFEFRSPRALDEVLLELREHGEDARILAGGQSLVPLMNFRMLQPAVLVSINDCAELSYIREEEDGVLCGALARQWDVENHPGARRSCPLLAEALRHVGGRSNRNRGTVCGSLTHADPLAELPAVALALDAVMLVNGPSGRREIAAADFFVGALENCLQPQEMLEATRFPRQPRGVRSAFLEMGNRKHGFALAGVALELGIEDGKCSSVRIAVMGGESTARRLHRTERQLLGSPVDAATRREMGRLATQEVEMAGDFHADGAYRKQLAGVLVERALAEAAAEPQPTPRSA